jgi:hypothetical protein
MGQSNVLLKRKNLEIVGGSQMRSLLLFCKLMGILIVPVYFCRQELQN